MIRPSCRARDPVQMKNAKPEWIWRNGTCAVSTSFLFSHCTQESSVYEKHIRGSHFSEETKLQNLSRFLKWIFRYFFIIFKATSKLFWRKICKFIKFHLNKKLTFQLYSKLVNLPFYISNLVSSVVFHH